ncbi:MAG: urea ABC transporter permease subunit UrtC [Candidatus Poribacteria bacterium]|nr:urea ABC transporter permease subunit UrtC [Candidatus Poribacteria bacterium]
MIFKKTATAESSNGGNAARLQSFRTNGLGLKSQNAQVAATGGWPIFVQRYVPWALLFVGLVMIPLSYYTGLIAIGTVNMLGRYMAFAIVAVGLDLIWGYTGILSLCQSFFFALGGYAMGMYLAHHGGPEGIIDANNWKIPACLYVVYPYKVGEAPGDALVPWFWKPFYTLPVTALLGLLIPGLAALVIGYVGFRSRVRGVYFAILTQAITVAGWLVFCMNNMKLCGTNGLTRFDRIAGFKLANPSVKVSLYILTLLSLVGVYALCRYIVKSRLGRVLIAIRDDETTLRFSGYKPYIYKLFAFVLAGMIAGLGGMLYAPQMGIFTPANMEASASILVVVWVAVGGRGALSGAILGALAVNLLYNFFTSEKDFLLFVWKAEFWQFILGGLFIGVVLLLPGGLIDLWRRLVRAAR